MSTPTRIRWLGTGTGSDEVGQVLHGEEPDHPLRLKVTRERVRVDLWHHLLELSQTGLGDDALGVTELVVRDAALNVLADVGGLDLDARGPLDPEQHVEQVDRLGS